MIKRLSFFSVFVLLLTACSKKHDHGLVSTFAGCGLMGSENGVGTSASFSNLMGLAAGPAGDLFVADSQNNLIRKIDPDGVVTTVAGCGKTGADDGNGLTASFFYPAAICVDKKGNVFVADKQNNLIRKIAPNGAVTTVVGRVEKNEDYGGKFPLLDYPSGIAVDAAGNIFVADSFHNKIRKISADGKITTIAGNIEPGSKDGSGASASFYIPEGLVLDSKGNLYVADTFNNMIRKISPAGIVTTIAGQTKKGAANGKGKAASFLHPDGLAVDKADNIYVADSGNNLIRKISPDGMVTTVAGSRNRGAENGEAKKATFFKPMGVSIDKLGNIYVADFENNVVRKVNY